MALKRRPRPAVEDPPLKVLIKYCGGCNPDYDRVALVDHLKERLKNNIQWVQSDAKEADVILLIAGCKTACVKVDQIKDLKRYLITGPHQGEEWIEEIS